MTPFDLRWLWRALRGRSITFALVFFLAVAGLSAPRFIRGLLEPLPLPWLVGWFAPLILIALLAKLEPRIIPSEKHRIRIAVGLIAAAVAFALVVPRLLPRESPPPEDETAVDEREGPKRLRSPARR